MTSKSHVGMGYDICPICGTKHNECVLLDKHLKETLERENQMAVALCPEHAAMRKEYIALVEVFNAPPSGDTLKPHEAQRTGQVAHIKRVAAKQIFNVPMPDDLAFVYVEVGVIEQLQSRMPQT